MPASFERKIVEWKTLLARRALLAAPLLFTNGVFDILHRGHVTYLDNARALGASLVVGVNSDASARRLGKGYDRPINLEADRMALLAALESVDYVVMFNDLTPIKLIRLLRPDILVKGGDYDMDKLPESSLVRSWGGRTLAIPFEHDHSTTKLLWRIRPTDHCGLKKQATKL
ncbi:D-glycero-beta-D-manno-heptose 1-phosphate adenylyltransferase [Candidatus Vallotia tarda]|uniref:D-beta-D-heptose 1-phosphate adenylyltransferase n=1 Tax=Candidatus Vallotiella hemipterorum TaxID=1177213 RepID=A0A916NF24_9BURK|nr:D-glycero-beta-D-manno-heptose 1-phosphate adenylyltransferase [Candidatus Vallotia tarda]CAG7595972.1 D-beta-D-heptose 1-phosphate adenylyltransferase [Candidatus Vallotia tarda]